MCDNECLRKQILSAQNSPSYLHICISVVTGLGHPHYPSHLGHFLSGSKWVSPGHAYMPDPDQIY